MEFLAVVAGVAGGAVRMAAEETTGGLTINLFWVLVSALNFVIFIAVIWTFAFRPLSGMLTARRERIEQGLKDAEQARRERESAEQARVAVLVDARREANEIINRAQKVSDETREIELDERIRAARHADPCSTGFGSEAVCCARTGRRDLAGAARRSMSLVPRHVAMAQFPECPPGGPYPTSGADNARGADIPERPAPKRVRRCVGRATRSRGTLHAHR